MKRDFQYRSLDRGYPLEFIESLLTAIEFSSRKAALQTKPRTSKTFCLLLPHTNRLRQILKGFS